MTNNKLVFQYFTSHLKYLERSFPRGQFSTFITVRVSRNDPWNFRKRILLSGIKNISLPIFQF